MVSIGTQAWSLLERRSSDAFLVAGVLLLASPAHVVVERFIGLPLPSWVVALFILPGLFATLVGLLGLYPRLTDQSPRLALAGGVITTATGGILVVLLGWILSATVLTAVSTTAIGLPPDAAFTVLSVLMTLAFLLFGVASLRSATASPIVGLLLLSFAIPWIMTVAATVVYGSTFPEWLLLAIYGPIPLVMLATGYRLRTVSAPSEQDNSSVDVTPG